ncbi:MAG: flagellar basal-body MS-ring/collar protein FliF [Armatimonadota bacterium]
MQPVEQLTELWKRLDLRARITIITAAVICLGGLIAFTCLQAASGYVPLYSGLTPETAGQITEKLTAQKVPYRLESGGRVIMVPEKQLYEQRIALAREGLPSTGQLGFEIFDRSGLPGTQFSNNINYQRALQGELCRTLEAMTEIAQARVHLVLPEETLFSEQTHASASVVLTPQPGAQITQEVTASIAHIVASATPGIKPEQVTVADNAGRVLRGPESVGQFGGLSASQMEVQRQYEERLNLRLQSMLDTVLGPNQSVVQAQAQLDFDTEETKQETVSPVAAGKGLVTSEKVREERYTGGGGRAGVAGLSANLGLASGEAGSGSGMYLNRDETREYQFSRRSSSVVKAPGALKTLTLAVVIDEGLSMGAEQQVRDLVTAAAGINSDRGDVITVERMKMAAAAVAKTQEAQYAAADKSERRQRLLQTVLRGGLSLAAAGLILMSVFVAVRQLRQQLPPMPIGVSQPAADASHLELLTNVRETAASPAQPQAPALGISEETGQRVRDQLRELTRDNPPAVADRLLALLHEKSA